MTSATQYIQAATILETGARARTVPPGSTVNHLQILAEELYVFRWLPGGIAGEIMEWLLRYLKPFQDVLDSLAGDPAAIGAASQIASRCADTVTGAVADTISAGDRITRQHWTGPAADSYSLVVVAMRDCLAGYGAAARAISSGELAVGERVGAVRQYVTDSCGDMLVELVHEAFTATVWAATTGPAAIQQFIAWASGFMSMYLQNVIQVMQALLADVTGVLGQVAGVGDSMARAASVLEGHGDPGPDGYLPPDSTAATYKGTTPNPEDLKFAQTCDLVNSDPTKDAGFIGRQTVGGYRRLTNEEVRALGIDPALLRNDADGFASGVFFNEATKQYVVTITGTDFGTREDVGEDATGAMTVSPQSTDAIRLANAINSSPLAQNAVYVGHSLGGRLAAVASMESGNPAITFNSAGVSPATVAYMASENGITTQDMYARLKEGQVRQYSTADDPLTNIQEKYPSSSIAPDGVGSRISLGGASINPKYAHEMVNVRNQMEKAYPYYNK